MTPTHSTRRRTSATILLALAALAGCSSEGGTNPSSGPLRIGIVSGNRQRATAAPAALPQGVTSQLVRLANGSLAMRPAPTAGQRVAGLLARAFLPELAYAQTTLNGSPVPGNVVCASPASDDNPLTPVVLCANTDAQGLVTFVFTHGNKAGEALAVVKGMVGNTAVTLDTARATILPDAVTLFGGWSFNRDTALVNGQSADLAGFGLKARDRYMNPVTTFAWRYQRINRDTALTDHQPATGSIFTARAGDTVVYAFADTARSGAIHLRVTP